MFLLLESLDATPYAWTPLDPNFRGVPSPRNSRTAAVVSHSGFLALVTWSIRTPGITSQSIDPCSGKFGSRFVGCLSRSLLVTTQATDPYWVQVNVTVDNQPLNTWLIKYGLKAPLKKRSHSLIFSIEPNAVGDIEPLGSASDKQSYPCRCHFGSNHSTSRIRQNTYRQVSYGPYSRTAEGRYWHRLLPSDNGKCVSMRKLAQLGLLVAIFCLPHFGARTSSLSLPPKIKERVASLQCTSNSGPGSDCWSRASTPRIRSLS
jgi:hypothetical protein